MSTDMAQMELETQDRDEKRTVDALSYIGERRT